MTNEELDKARAKHAYEQSKAGDLFTDIATHAARLAREGWMPPEPVDPDLVEAREISERVNYDAGHDTFSRRSIQGQEDGSEDVLCALAGIKRGRALAAAEATPGLVWVKHDGSKKNPLDRRNSWILVNRVQRGFGAYYSSNDATFDWRDVTHYAVITQPEDVA